MRIVWQQILLPNIVDILRCPFWALLYTSRKSKWYVIIQRVISTNFAPVNWVSKWMIKICSVLRFLFWLYYLTFMYKVFGLRHRMIKKINITLNTIQVKCTKINSDRYLCMIALTAVSNILEILYWTPLIRIAKFPSPNTLMLLFEGGVEYLGPIVNIISIMWKFNISEAVVYQNFI